jgi:hypothetical protein
MASTITAGNATNGLALSCDNTGILELKTGTGAGTTALTLNASQNATFAGTITAAGGVGGTPAFSAYQNAATTVNNSTWTKIAIQVEEFDTANCFDSTTNFRFTPNVAGYYQVGGTVNFAPNSSGFRFVSIYKNGSSFKNGQNTVGGAVNFTAITVSALIYFNGSTDYVELYANQNSGSNLATSGNADVYFYAAMVRGA